MTITLIICATVLLIVIAALTMGTPSENPRTPPCYFGGVHVELLAPGGRQIGAQACSGRVEYVYAVRPEEPSYGLNGTKICPAHVGAMSELAACLVDGTRGYWLIPDSK